MTELQFLSPDCLWLLLWLPAFGVLIKKTRQGTSLALEVFSKRPHQLQQNRHFGFIHGLTFICLTLALAQPVWDPKPETQSSSGRDMILLLDVSRSMLANDARPNRLEVAKQAISKAIESSDNERFGLVAFAGSASILSPLNADKTFLRRIIASVNSQSVSQGGTQIDAALLKIADKMLTEKSAKNTDILLITDGEDLGAFPQRALSQLNQLGVRLIVIGIGDSRYGARIPNREGQGWVIVNGQEHWSKMAAVQLKRITDEANQGLFLPVGTATFDLGNIISKLKLILPARQIDVRNHTSFTQGFPYCLFAALLIQLFGLLKGGRTLLAGIFLLSFNANAFNASAFNTSAFEAEAQGQNHASAATLLQYDEQIQLAADVFAEDPLKASEIYSAIAQATENLDIAINANYNQATSLIHYAQLLEDGSYWDEDTELLEDDELPDPEPIYGQAEKILRLVLTQSATHHPAARNLEWLTVRAFNRSRENDNQQMQNSHNQDSEQKQDGQHEQEDNNSDKSNSEPEQQKPQSQEQDQSSQVGDGLTSDAVLPSVTVTAQQILSEMKSRDNRERKPKLKKQHPVERDW